MPFWHLLLCSDGFRSGSWLGVSQRGAFAFSQGECLGQHATKPASNSQRLANRVSTEVVQLSQFGTVLQVLRAFRLHRSRLHHALQARGGDLRILKAVTAWRRPETRTTEATPKVVSKLSVLLTKRSTSKQQQQSTL